MYHFQIFSCRSKEIIIFKSHIISSSNDSFYVILMGNFLKGVTCYQLGLVYTEEYNENFCLCGFLTEKKQLCTLLVGLEWLSLLHKTKVMKQAVFS